MDYFQMAYTVLGGLGIFFLGMKYLSESLQAMAGDLIKNLITKVTSNRIIAVIVGLSVTAIIQSSSISTVMVVGLVNANLMTLTQAIGVILGANIGTTITGWILTIKIGKYGLLLIGTGIFPMLFIKKKTLGSIGKVIVALGFIFFGLQLMSGAFKPLRTDPGFLSMLQYFHAQSIVSLLGCVLIGCLLTFIIQSSSAMLGITIALATTGSITFETAAALVLGENIGTTITAQLACIGAGINAKRAAVSHAFFNLFGVIFIVLIFPYYTNFIDFIIPGIPNAIDAEGGKPFIAAHIAASHTIFNVSATLLFLPFVQHLARFVIWLIPSKETKEIPHLKYLRTGGVVSSGVAIKMAVLELENMAQIASKALSHTRKYVLEEPSKETYDKVMKLEQITDNIQKEMTAFVCQAMEGTLLVSQTSEAYSLIRAADELESIVDQAQSLCRYRYRLIKNQQEFSEVGWQQLTKYFDQTFHLFYRIVENLQKLRGNPTDEYHDSAEKLSEEANEVRDQHIERMREGVCNPLAAMTFSDIMVSLRRLKNHAINFVEAITYQANSSEKSRKQEEEVLG